MKSTDLDCLFSELPKNPYHKIRLETKMFFQPSLLDNNKVQLSTVRCFPCPSSVGPPKISCRVFGILYHIVCNICDGKNDQVVYHNESGHNAYTRGGSHLKKYCMSIHSRVHHPEAEKRCTAEWRFSQCIELH